MKYIGRNVQKGTRRIVVTFLGIFAVTVSLLASKDCFTWDDPLCSYLINGEGTCGGCEETIELPVTDPGTHWICNPVEKGWLTCPTDTPCHYKASGHCIYCQFYNIFDIQGPNDQLVGGGDCPPPSA